MKNLTAITVLAFGLCLTANADIWKWVDVYGETHFVSTMTTIYSWLDENGKVHYSDKPEHGSATIVQLVWHSKGDLAADGSVVGNQTEKVDPNVTIDEESERQLAEAYYCKRAREIYDAYANAPMLYKTGADGKKKYLTDEEVEATLSAAKSKVTDFCE